MDAAVYTRVSTDEQDSSNQLPALERLAAARGFRVVATFSDVGSGSKTSRPQLDRMLEGARRGQYKVVLVWALDRLGRDMRAVFNTVLDLDRIGVSVISHQETWLDTHGPVRPLLLAVFSWVAQQERDRLIERTRAGIARARREGKTLGRPRVAVDIDQALRLIKGGTSMRQTAKRLGVATSVLHRALQSDDVPAGMRAKRNA